MREELKSAAGESRDALFMRLCGTLLKLGRAREVLNEMSRYLADRGLEPKKSPPAFSLLVAYAYIHEHDYDQALAWFGLANSANNTQDIVAQQAALEAKKTISSIPASIFTAISERWSGDPFIGPMFSQESFRRSQGGLPTAPLEEKWFNRSFYQPPKHEREPGEIAETDIPAPYEVAPEPAPGTTSVIVPQGTVTIGELLPLSGQFTEHAQHIKEGIELALEKYAWRTGNNQTISLVSGDTQGDPNIAENEYERLSKQEGACLILGPLLAKTSEQVAQKSKGIGVPFISFTKRDGFTALSPFAFQLGATSKSQVEALVDYVVKQEGLRLLSIIYPETASGHEFAALFRKTLENRGISLNSEGSYKEGNSVSINRALAMVSKGRAQIPQAIFLPDTLENSLSLLEQIKASSLASSLLLGSALWDDPAAVRGYGPLLDNAIFVSPFNPASDRPIVAEFVESYKRKFGHLPELLAAQAYDAATLSFTALTKSEASSSQVVHLLKNTAVADGVTGSLKISENGEINRRMSLYRIRQGETQEITPSLSSY